MVYFGMTDGSTNNATLSTFASKRHETGIPVLHQQKSWQNGKISHVKETNLIAKQTKSSSIPIKNEPVSNSFDDVKPAEVRRKSLNLKNLQFKSENSFSLQCCTPRSVIVEFRNLEMA